MKKLVAISFFVGSMTTASIAYADTSFTAGGLGCVEIVSMRPSTQRPLQTEIYDEYKPKRNPHTGGVVFQALGAVPGFGVASRVASDLVAGQIAGAVTASNAEANRQAEVSANKYKDVMAIEFKFDDGEVMNLPIYVVSGMRYKVGARLNVRVSRHHPDIIVPSLRPLFWTPPMPGEAKYDTVCHITDAANRRRLLDLHKDILDEAQVIDPSQRRIVATKKAAELSEESAAVPTTPTPTPTPTEIEGTIPEPTAPAKLMASQEG